jgi:hypothetical protein
MRYQRAEWAESYDDKPPELLHAAGTFAPVGEVVIAALCACDRVPMSQSMPFISIAFQDFLTTTYAGSVQW